MTQPDPANPSPGFEPVPSPRDIAAPQFTPVPLLRERHDGWSAGRQRAFLRALVVTGSVSAAARMVGMSRKSAYNLRSRAGAESFAAAWEIALAEGRERMFDCLFERALNGVTTIRLRMGGVVEVGHGPDSRLLASRAPGVPPSRYSAPPSRNIT